MESCQELLKLFLTHVVELERAHVPYIPKHHMMAHLTLQVPFTGNPKVWATFLDESLNAIVSGVAGHTHPARWEVRIYERLRMQGRLDPNTAFA